MNWIRETFMGVDGRPSFKRQGLFLLLIATVVAVFMSIEVTALTVLAGIFAGLTVVERSKKIM